MKYNWEHTSIYLLRNGRIYDGGIPQKSGKMPTSLISELIFQVLTPIQWMIPVERNLIT